MDILKIQQGWIRRFALDEQDLQDHDLVKYTQQIC